MAEMPRASRPDKKPAAAPARQRPLVLPRDVDNVVVRVAPDKEVRLTNLRKVFWTTPHLTKGDLLQYMHPKLVTAEYRVAHRPPGRVLVDYNQNAWGRTLASIYSARPRPGAPVSTPVTWDEVEDGVAIDDFRVDNVPARLAARGDLWAPVLAPRGRFRLESLFT